MKLTSFLASAALGLGFVSAGHDHFVFERLDKDKAMLLVVDHQVGLFHLVRDFEATVFHEAMVTHAAIADVFNLPVVMTTSAETGPNGPLPREIRQMFPDAPLIPRQGEVNAWDSEEFREAVFAANKTQIILGGIATDVCTAFLALSLREAGFSVWANAEASGTTSTFVRDISNNRMEAAGVHVVSMFAIVGDLMRDWRHVPGAAEMYPWFDRHFPAVGYVARGHLAAVENGTVFPGQEGLNG